MANARKSIRLPPAVGAFAALFKPRPAMEEGKPPRYELTLLFPKDDPSKLDGLLAAMKEVAKAQWGDKAEAVLKRLKHPVIRDGDEKDRPEFADHFFIRASSTKQPGVVGVVDGQKQLVFEDSEAYSGCTFVAAISLFAYDNAFGKGIGIGLDNVLVAKKGDRMDGRKSAEAEFADYEIE
jgi:hypothetical protein